MIISDNDVITNAIKKYQTTIKKIICFLNINYDVKLEIFNFKEFKREYELYIGKTYNKDITGFIEDDKNIIIILKFLDFKFTNHYNDTFEDYIKIIIHEHVHIIHSIACKHNYPSFELCEGIAVYLSNQYDFKNKMGSGRYYNYGMNIYNYLENHSQEDLLKILNVY